MDAVEIFRPNIILHDLRNRYNQVWCADIIGFEYEWYDLIIFGDVIEHMSVENAQKVLEYAKPQCEDMIVAVPYLYRQDEIYGNPWEKHIQNDLTDKIFNQRYKGFAPLWKNNEYGYYHKWER